MGPQLALLVGALAGCLRSARSCVICDQRVIGELHSLDTEYLPTHISPKDHREVMRKIKETVRNFTRLPDGKRTVVGVIDDATMELSVLSFVRSLRLLRDRDVRGDAFLKEFFEMATQEKEAFLQNIARFQREGMMFQRLLWCHLCRKRLYLCQKSFDCGVQYVNVHEKEDMILDCELSWHKLSEGLTNYSFYKVWGSNSEALMYTGTRPTLIKPLVGPEDAGLYRCELGTVRSGPATIIHFEVTVLPQRIIAETTSKSSTIAQTIAQTMSKSSTFVALPSTIETRSSTTVTLPSTIETLPSTIGTQPSTIVALPSTTGTQPSTIVALPSTSGTQPSTSGTQPGTWQDLSSTLKSSVSPKPKNVPRGRLAGLLIWGCVVLVVGLLTIALCSRPEKVMNSMNSRFPTYKRGVP
ncbi:izumo sperm-egg fusion protein 1-like isoform X2 [Suricata suricatta]|uniref:izumo sperm-egg fusion protein 1-like isoform X2 n=1 Tax=Suricata suricatta TaxID=37032 RepID=UPI001155B0DA|nr:izumo sperm-egg fusion protein 1-like isoform X2 [Suricata suricatta]